MNTTTDCPAPRYRIRARSSRRWAVVSLAEAAAIALLDPSDIEWAIEETGYASTASHIIRPAQ